MIYNVIVLSIDFSNTEFRKSPLLCSLIHRRQCFIFYCFIFIFYYLCPFQTQIVKSKILVSELPVYTVDTKLCCKVDHMRSVAENYNYRGQSGFYSIKNTCNDGSRSYSVRRSLSIRPNFRAHYNKPFRLMSLLTWTATSDDKGMLLFKCIFDFELQ